MWRSAERIIQESQPIVMGILNATPDSFSDGGAYRDHSRAEFSVDLGAIVERGRQLLREGATILDVGGESTRPGAEPVDEAEELRRVVPVVRALAKELGAIVSVDTYRASVADECALAGATIVNDVSAGRYVGSENRFADADEVFAEETAAVAARRGLAVVLMHMRGVPRTMQSSLAAYSSGVVSEVYEFLARRRDAFLNAGVPLERLCFDPGLGFGKSFEDNWTLAREASFFKTLGGALLYGHSRKSFLRETHRRYAERNGLAETATRETLDLLTSQTSFALARRGVDVLRVHNASATALALDAARFFSESRSPSL